MDLEPFFNVLGKIWVAGEILLAVFTTTRPGKGKTHDRGSQILLWVVIIASSWIDAWMHKFFPFDMPGSYSWLRPVALGILILGLGVRTVAIVTLGGAFSANVATRAGQRLQRSGLYGLVRHPSYLGLGAHSPGVCPSFAHLGLFCRFLRSIDSGCVVSHSCRRDRATPGLWRRLRRL